MLSSRYGRWVTRRVAVATIASVWLLAALVSFVPISLGLHRPPQPLLYTDGHTNYPTCALDLTPTYAVVSSCVSFYVPCVVMIGKSPSFPSDLPASKLRALIVSPGDYYFSNLKKIRETKSGSIFLLANRIPIKMLRRSIKYK